MIYPIRPTSRIRKHAADRERKISGTALTQVPFRPRFKSDQKFSIPFHLFRYLDEQAFRFNNRKTNDAEGFTETLSSVVGKRLTYKGLTGKSEPQGELL